MRSASGDRQAVYFFAKPGAENTDSVISTIEKRAKAGDIEAVVVASVSGRTAVGIAETFKRRRLATRVVCVSGPSSWKKDAPQYKFPLISERERARLKGLGVEIVDHVQEPFRRIIFHDWWEKKTLAVGHPESDLFWMTLISVGGHGFRTAVEVVFGGGGRGHKAGAEDYRHRRNRPRSRLCRCAQSCQV